MVVEEEVMTEMASMVMEEMAVSLRSPHKIHVIAPL